MKENIRFYIKYRVVTPCSWSSHKMKPCYEGLKEIGVDVDEIWRKMLDFRVSIGLLPLDFDCLCKMKACYEGLKEIRVEVQKFWREVLDFRVSIG